MAGAFGTASAPLESISQRMALFVPFEEMTGVAPCGPSVSGDCEAVGEEAIIPPDIGNAIKFPFPGAT